MGLIDSHAHLTYPELFGQLDDVLRRAEEAGVSRIITIGTDLEDARRAVELAARFPGRIHAAAAIHPHHAGKVSAEGLEAVCRLWDRPEIVALGEMGLDYHYDFADRAVQRKVFGELLTRAREHDRPLIIHSREAFSDLSSLLLEHGYANRRVVFHCFTGTVEEAAVIAEHGWRISFTGIVTFKKSQWLQEIAKAYPADQIMVETDSPYLSPEPVRRKTPNEPAHVAHVARFLAALRQEDFAEFANRTGKNTVDFFGLE